MRPGRQAFLASAGALGAVAIGVAVGTMEALEGLVAALLIAAVYYGFCIVALLSAIVDRMSHAQTAADEREVA